MHSFSRLSVLSLCSLPLWLGAQPTPATPLADEKILSLDAFVVSSGPDAKTAFDLAQGASILAGHDLQLRATSTLGETLAATPGVSSTYYGPGASRPLIRGLGGDRVRMLDNGVGSLDASNVSPDHNVSLEPLLVDRIEVLRGPATLLYGSSAVGGVVNVIDNRIPSFAEASDSAARRSAATDLVFGGRSEVRVDSAADERTGIFALTGTSQAFALQVNGLRSTTGDVSIPGFADPEHPADRGTLLNSAVSTRSGSVGGALSGAGGSLGVAVSEFDTRYGVPVGEPIDIDLRQRRLDFRGELTRPFGPFKSAKARFGLADYTHAEVDTTTGRPNTTFRNQAYEGRLELAQQELGALSGTVGLQVARSDFSAVGEEVVTPPTLTTSRALFALESLQLDPALTVQFGARYEHQDIQLGAVDPSLPSYPGYRATSGGRRQDDAVSLSAGTVYYPAKDWSLGLSIAYSQRIPTAQELFSNGPHGGTQAYEVGSAGLGRETSLGLDLVLRKRAGAVTGSVGGFVNRFRDFIFESRDPGAYFDEDTGAFQAYPVPDGTAFLPIYQFVAKDALFHGGEAELTFHLVEGAGYHLHLMLGADYVQAEQTTDDEPLPRIPPRRTSIGLHFENERWIAGVELRNVARQDRVAADESPTAGYTLANANVSYLIPARRVNAELFVRGTNLANRDARVHTSFLKEIAPLPGRNVTAGVRLTF